MLITIGYVALLIGVVLVIAGFTVEPRALRPGLGCIILGVVLIVLAYLLPTLTTHDTYDNDPAAQSLLTLL